MSLTTNILHGPSSIKDLIEHRSNKYDRRGNGILKQANDQLFDLRPEILISLSFVFSPLVSV